MKQLSAAHVLSVFFYTNRASGSGCDVRITFREYRVEGKHRTVKRIASRKQCTIMETVYWYNVTSEDDISEPDNSADTTELDDSSGEMTSQN